jgi:preprotein translocase subunit SecG
LTPLLDHDLPPVPIEGLTTMPIQFAYTLIVLLIITSILLTLLVLLHRGKGGGLSSMFGGGVSSSIAGSSVAEKNLDRYTVLVGIVWFACIVGLGLWLKLELPATTAG